MKPEVFVSFTVTIHKSLAIEHEFPNISIDDLQKYILEHGPKNFGMPYVVTIKCKNNVVDTDKTCEKIPLLRQHDYINNHPIISTEDDCKFDIIMPKLIYANDVKEHLIKTYGALGKFDPKKFDPKTPVFFEIFEHKKKTLEIQGCQKSLVFAQKTQKMGRKDKRLFDPHTCGSR